MQGGLSFYSPPMTPSSHLQNEKLEQIKEKLKQMRTNQKYKKKQTSRVSDHDIQALIKKYPPLKSAPAEEEVAVSAGEEQPELQAHK
jgi:cytochrome c553